MENMFQNVKNNIILKNTFHSNGYVSTYEYKGYIG